MVISWMLLAGSLPYGVQEAPGLKVQNPNGPILLGDPAQRPLSPGARKTRRLAGATVEVTGSLERDAEAIRSYARWMAPELKASALQGYAGRESVQQLGAFMLQDPSHPKPPSVGRFHYNAFAPPPLAGPRR